MTDPATTEPGPADPRQLRAEIARTRADLGAPIEALAARADVKNIARDAVTDATRQAVHKARQLADTTTDLARRTGPALPVAVLALAAAATVAVVTDVIVWVARRAR